LLYKYTTNMLTTEAFSIQVENHVAHVVFNRPDKMNALDRKGWQELKMVFDWCNATADVRAVVLSGEGKHFCAGIDLSLLMSLKKEVHDSCEGRLRENLRLVILDLQQCVTAIEQCRKPVLAAVHGGCIGGGLDIVCACDMRYATHDAFFTIKEIDMGMVADLGTLQRLPKLIGDGIVRELAYTGRKMSGTESVQRQLCNSSFGSKEEMMAQVLGMAQEIAAKSPLSVRGTKEMLLYSRDHSVADGLNYIATWNAAMMMSEDLANAFQAQLTKKSPSFKD
jgi:enoyl-CoA hydratase